MKVITSIDDAVGSVGEELGVSEWREIDQDRINAFADATGDHQWIHIDVERAKTESPYGTTIAHGFLTLSLIPYFFETGFSVRETRMVVNYGLNKVRFTAPVPVGSRLRAAFTLLALEDANGGAKQLTVEVAIEREGAERPVCIAESLARHYRCQSVKADVGDRV